MNSLLHGSIVLIPVWLALGGLGLPFPEDIALLSTGVLIHRSIVPWALALPIAIVSVLAGDLTLFLLARRLGPRALEYKRMRRLLPPKRQAHIEALFARYGGRIVFFARHVAGLRSATFTMAGIHQMPVRQFVLWDAAAACLSVPIMLTLGYLGSVHVERVKHGVDRAEHWLAVVVVIVGLGFVIWRHHQLLSPTNRGARKPEATTARQ